MRIIKYIKILIFIITIYFCSLNYTNAAINFTVSPPLYKIEAFTWTTIYKTATLINNSNQSVEIFTTKTDFQSNWSSWIPQFVRYSELVHPDQELSTWINIDTNSFFINNREKKIVNFSISIPDNATPWWHYWAVCFKNNKSEVSSWSSININVDYCILLLVNVDWEIIDDIQYEDTEIKAISWWWYSTFDKYKNNINKDNCPIIDLTASENDGKCIDNFFKNDEEIEELIDNVNEGWHSEININDFSIDFETIIKNDWNTHVELEWEIILKDENWNQIKWIWKKTIKNEHWAKIWEKIIDYLPINDEWWNILPWQERNFNVEWKGFPYETYDENWKIKIDYWTPEEYYERKVYDWNNYLFPWQRINERIVNEKIRADITLKYINYEWEEVEFNSAKDFDIFYKEKYVWLNSYVIVCFWSFIFVLFLLWLIFRKKRRKCKYCKNKIEKNMKICPYCLEKQDIKISKILKN
jgi:hypothetical protein